MDTISGLEKWLLQMPTLRSRTDDILPLAEWSLKHALANIGARPHQNLHAELNSCRTLFEAYSWPGNVREMRNMMDRLGLFWSAAVIHTRWRTPSISRYSIF